jgi:hypothetical protein
MVSRAVRRLRRRPHRSTTGAHLAQHGETPEALHDLIEPLQLVFEHDQMPGCARAGFGPLALQVAEVECRRVQRIGQLVRQARGDLGPCGHAIGGLEQLAFVGFARGHARARLLQPLAQRVERAGQQRQQSRPSTDRR